jgi:hypothetical protein
MGYDRGHGPDELDRLLSTALQAAVRGVRPPARLSAAVCAAAAAPLPVPHRSGLRTLLDALVACLTLTDRRRPMPLMMHAIGFADVGSVSAGEAWSWAVYPAGRCEPGRSDLAWETLGLAG